MTRDSKGCPSNVNHCIWLHSHQLPFSNPVPIRTIKKLLKIANVANNNGLAQFQIVTKAKKN